MRLTMIRIRYNFCRMYICICKGVTDSAIRREVQAGATSFREVRNQLGVGTQCGKCACEARQIIAETLEPQPAATLGGMGFYEPAMAG